MDAIVPASGPLAEVEDWTTARMPCPSCSADLIPMSGSMEAMMGRRIGYKANLYCARCDLAICLAKNCGPQEARSSGW